MTGGTNAAETDFLRHLTARSKAAAHEARSNRRPVPRLSMEVTCRVSPAGRLTPLSIDWEGQQLPVSAVLDCRPGSSRKHEENGLRYRVRIADMTVQLYYEASRWYLEYAGGDSEELSLP